MIGYDDIINAVSQEGDEEDVDKSLNELGIDHDAFYRYVQEIACPGLAMLYLETQSRRVDVVDFAATVWTMGFAIGARVAQARTWRDG